MNPSTKYPPERIRPLMPGQLSSDGVGNGGHELATQAQLCTQLAGKLLRTVTSFRDVPLELVCQRDIAHVDVQLEGGNNLIS